MMSEQTKGEYSFDLVVVGGGTAGMSCASAAAECGLNVAVIEQAQSPGGSLHVSGGMLAAAGTNLQRERGVDDDQERHLADALEIARDGYDEAILREVIAISPSYIDWLQDVGFRFVDECPAIYYSHEPYSIARTYWGEARGESILEVLMRPWNKYVEEGKITPFLSHVFGELVIDDDVVTGVVIADIDSQDVKTLNARDVVMCTGGFGSNPKLLAELTDVKFEPPAASNVGNQGAGLQAILDAGGAFRKSYELLRLGRFPRASEPTRIDHAHRADLEARVRDPREIWVTKDGKRFVDESLESTTQQNDEVMKLEKATFWVVFDTKALEGAGPPLIRGWTPEMYRNAANRDVLELWKADTLTELAAKAGIDSDGLQQTVADWNESVHNGTAPWQPGTTPYEISTGPFFALMCRSSSLMSFSGVMVTPSLAVRREDGGTIEHLYAVGEILGAATYNGSGYVGGMGVTPALALGRELGWMLGGRTTRLGAVPQEA
jgi:fumarate reductase flavoprotein subunit